MIQSDLVLPLGRTNMRKYKSHKEVWASKIINIEPDPKAVGGYYVRAEKMVGEYVPKDFFARSGEPSADLGYFVKYEDGYTSWSPTDAFESGYTEIEA